MTSGTEKMRPAWKQYQEDAAALFRSLGFSAETDAAVNGARGGNNVDVLVDGSVGGIAFRWIVECKLWKSSVSKEKAQAFITVVQNVGADRGYLLSESGFQSGAVDVTRHTNIHLGSIAALRADTAEWCRGDVVQRWRERKNILVRVLLKMHKIEDQYFSKYSEATGPIFGLDPIIDEALRGEYPVPFGDGKTVEDWEELTHEVEARLAVAEKVAGLVDKPYLTSPFYVAQAMQR